MASESERETERRERARETDRQRVKGLNLPHVTHRRLKVIPPAQDGCLPRIVEDATTSSAGIGFLLTLGQSSLLCMERVWWL